MRAILVFLIFPGESIKKISVAGFLWAGLPFEGAFERGKTSIGESGIVLKCQRSQHVLGNNILRVGTLLVEYFAKESLQLVGDGRVEQQE